ncbi:MAG: ATP-binding protein, partial [Candidatus Nanohaloarchaea archaeon]
MTDQVGTIIASEETPTPEEVQFVLQEQVNKDQFVEFDTEEGRAIARVSNVRKTNRYFMEAESVSEYERSGVAMDDVLPTEDWEYLVGEGRVLGVYDANGMIQRPSFPPSPGTEIALADEDRLEDFLGLSENGLNLGDVQFHDLAATLDMTKLFQKHLAILAQTGAGKSYLASVLLEELLDRDPDDGQLAVVAIDPHGEYAGFADDSEYMDRVKVFGSGDIQIGMPQLTAGKLDQYFYDVSAAQKREMHKVLDGLQDDKGVFGLDDVIARVEERDMKKSTRQVWLDRLRRMRYMHLFKRYDSPSLDKVEPGTMLVLDLSDIVDHQKKQIIAAYFTSRLFRARRNGDVPPY